MTESSQEALAPPRQRRSYAAQVAREVLLRWGARIGLTWILILVMVAVFAPFLATSHPLLARGEGGLMAPVLEHLTAADVTLLVVFFTGVLVAFLRRPFWHKLLAVLAMLVISGSISAFTVSPPELVIYEQHREAEAAGQYDWVMWAPVPYSPKDYLRDFG
ncbi:MAG: ABC transporter permease, partial [Chromatiaceae bacterium]